MNRAEFRVLREGLGFTTDGLARHLKVKRQSVTRWESGDYRIPDGVLAELQGLADAADQLAAALVRDLGVQEAPTLVTYRDGETPDGRPASWHRAVAGRVRDQVPGVRITYP